MITLKTLSEVESFIEKANTILGYPDNHGTETYCNVPTPNEAGEYELPVTNELNEAMIAIATKQMLDETTNAVV